MPIGTNLHTIPYDGGESTSTPPVCPHHDASSTTAHRTIGEERLLVRVCIIEWHDGLGILNVVYDDHLPQTIIVDVMLDGNGDSELDKE